MATLQQKIDAEHKARKLLEDQGLPEPDEIEYGHTCVRLIWSEPKVCMVVQIDEPPPAWVFAEDMLAGALPKEVTFDENEAE